MDVILFGGVYYTRGHYRGSEFAQAVLEQYGKIIPSSEVRRTHWRASKSGTTGKFGFSAGGDYTFVETAPGHGAFAVTVWKP